MAMLAQNDPVEGDRLVQQIAVAQVETLEGRRVMLRELWGEQPTMTCFLRHFGCLFCHQMVSDVLEIIPAVIAKGAQVVLVGNGSVEQASYFFAQKGLPAAGCVVVTDAARESYRAAEFKRGLGVTFLKGGARAAYSKARSEGHRNKGLFGDLTQLGGVLLTRPPSNFVAMHRSEHAGDHPDLKQLLAAVQSMFAGSGAFRI